jgi:GNAT superfamily N-acetyltransferase
VRPDNVRLARRGDETALFALVCDSDDEWAIGLRDDSKVRDVIELAVSGHDTQRPSFGVIEGADCIEGAVGLYPTEVWNCRKLYLRGFFHYVRPEYRRMPHGRRLMQFAEWFADTAGMLLVWELFHDSDALRSKQDLYARRARMFGSLYLHYGEAW